MPQFAYSARDRAGQPVQATLEAPSRKEAVRVLTARGLTIAALSESGGGTDAAKAAAKRRPGAGTQTAPEETGSVLSTLTALSSSGKDIKPQRAERLPFLESLHDLTTSGLSAGEAVRLLSVRIKEPRLRALSAGLWARLSEGAPLSRAMGDFPAVFDPATNNLIRAGEATGSLNETLARLIAHLTEQRELRRQLLTALAYPVFMMFVSGGVILFFLFFLLPRLQTLLNSLHGQMPVSTRLLVGVSNFTLHYGFAVVIVAAIVVLSFWRWRATEAGRQRSDAWLLKLPLVGPFIVSQTVLAFSQTLSVLLENGITASDALRMTERQIDNRVHRAAFDQAIDRVLEGEALSASLGRTGCFPDLVLDRLSVGENTGNVVPSLKDIARAYQKLISNQLNMFTKVIASGVLMAVFVFVGFIAFAIVSAVFQVSASFKMG
jgi:type II secretory pathway component PulF